MKKNNTQFLLVGLFIGLVVDGGVFAFFQPTPKITIPDKMEECISQGGQFSLRDWSWKEDNSEYKIRCLLPVKELFFEDIKTTN